MGDDRPLGVDPDHPEIDFYFVACPTCGAKVKFGCRSRTGNVAPPHAARREAGAAMRAATSTGRLAPRDSRAEAIADFHAVAERRNSPPHWFNRDT